jgi:hypothetical protein
MSNNGSSLQGIRYTMNGWEVYSPLLQFPVPCGCASDAKRVAMAIEAKFKHLDSIDYTEIDAAIAHERAARVFNSGQSYQRRESQLAEQSHRPKPR